MFDRLRLSLAGALAVLALPAAAADLALVIDASGDGRLQDDTAFLAEALNAQGYEVYEPAEPGRPGMRQAIAGFEQRLGEADRALIVFAGRSFEAGGEVWLLPATFNPGTRVAAAFGGVPLDLLLGLAADRPGRAAVVIAHQGEVPPLPEPPQGVLLIAGPRAAALDAVTGRLLQEGSSVAAALDGLGGVRIAGFRAPDVGFAGDSPAAVPAPAAPSPEQRAEAQEAALGLGRDARRRVQEDLTVLGYATRGIDGIFGAGTRTAIGEWQRAEGFPVTGYLAPDQIARLRQRAEARTAELAAEAERARAAEAAADDAFWQQRGSGGAADLRAYLDRYPDGRHAAEARARLDQLEARARAEAEAEDRAAWDAALADGSVAAFRRYLERYPEGAFTAQAEARIAALDEAPRQQAARERAVAAEEALGLNQASRALIEGQLAALGYAVGEQDGRFDRESRRALRQFQSRQGLPPTGFVDQATVQALIVASLGLR